MYKLVLRPSTKKVKERFKHKYLIVIELLSKCNQNVVIPKVNIFQILHSLDYERKRKKNSICYKRNIYSAKMIIV